VLVEVARQQRRSVRRRTTIRDGRGHDVTVRRPAFRRACCYWASPSSVLDAARTPGKTRSVLTPIEAHVRADDPASWTLVIRGRPLTVEGLLIAAGRTMAEFSWRGDPLAAVSAEVTGPDRSTDELLAGPRLRTRRTYAEAPVTSLVNAGFAVLATFSAPHVSIVLPNYDERCVRSLIELFGPEHQNPHYVRTLR
jgi:hypothetical protein